MQPGDKVEVHQVWAAGTLTPYTAWFKGYEFVSTDGRIAVVRHTEGMYKGIAVNYPLDHVRPEQ